MTLYSAVNPYPVILSQAGSGLNGGKVYIGVAGQDPETNPTLVYWDEAGTDPAAQPLSTIGGYIVRAGSPAQIYAPAEFSIRVRDRFGAVVFYMSHAGGQLAAMDVKIDDLIAFLASTSAAEGASRIGVEGGGTVQDAIEATYLTRATAITATIPAWVKQIRTQGFANVTDLGGATYVRVASEPSFTGAGKFRSADRYLPNGTTSSTNGGWWQMQEALARIEAFGAVGDNDPAKATANTTAINDAIAYSQSLLFPCPIDAGQGQFQINGAISAISRGVIIQGHGPRATIWNFSGAYDCLTFMGANGIRCANAGIRDMGFLCSGMSSGNWLTTDFTQWFTISNIFVSSPYNAWLIRQSGGPTIDNSQLENARGTYAIKAYGTGAARNNSVVPAEIDKIDGIAISNSVISGDYEPGSGTAQCDLIWLDGYVQTLNYDRIKLFHGRRAIRTSNTPGVANPLFPAFIAGADLEMESFWEQLVYLEYCSRFWANTFYCTGSDSKECFYASANARMIRLFGGEIRDAWLDGIITYSPDMEIHGVDVFRNALAGTGSWDGVKVNGGGFASFGGLIGKNTGEPAYTEKQRYGIANIAGTAAAVRTNLTGNQTAPTTGVVTVL